MDYPWCNIRGKEIKEQGKSAQEKVNNTTENTSFYIKKHTVTQTYKVFTENYKLAKMTNL